MPASPSKYLPSRLAIASPPNTHGKVKIIIQNFNCDFCSAYEESFRVSVCMFLPMYPGIIKMIEAGVFKIADVDPKVMSDKFKDDFKWLTEEAVRYAEKYDTK